jgi:AraC family transcriptional regulator of adaptative response / DNA-3-methyladenine glycosylase II
MPKNTNPSRTAPPNTAQNKAAAQEFLLPYTPPYRWDIMLSFFAARAIAGVETVSGGVYRRTFWAKCGTGWFEVENLSAQSALKLTVFGAEKREAQAVFEAAMRMFDTQSDPAAVARALSGLEDIHPALPIKGARLPGCFDPFEMSIRSILGQQITVKAAGTLANRLAKTFGSPCETCVEGLDTLFPKPEAIAKLGPDAPDALGALGIISRRAQTIASLGRLFWQNPIDFDRPHEPERQIKDWMTIPGIGAWTAHYMAMRALNWADAFPDTDYAVKKALAPRGKKEIIALAEPWRPFRAYACVNLWNADRALEPQEE